MMWFAPFLLLAPTLFEQSVVRVLTRDFPQAQFVLLSVETKTVIGQHWDSDVAIPLGSLVKPFLAVAFGRNPGSAKCDPSRCWQPAGHGEIGLVEAIAESCNSYFLQKAATRITTENLRSSLQNFGLPAPEDTGPELLIGLGTAWKITPTEMTRAYAGLVDGSYPRTILQGMRASALTGTAKLLRGAALAKTGTAPCSHRGKAPGDGYVAMLYPPAAPKYALLVQVHGVSGAEAARTAAGMLEVLRHGR